jgi:uncharacterized protein (DUF1499 family)
MHLVIAILGLLCLIAGPALAYQRMVPPMTGFQIFVASGALGVLAVLWGVVALVRRRGKRALAGVLLGLVPVAALGALGVLGFASPGVEDISTDLEDAPPLARTPDYPAELVPIVREAYPGLAPLLLDAPPGEVFQAVMELVATRPGWTLELGDARAGLIQGVAETELFHFRHDFAIRVRKRGAKTVVDMRSRSREDQRDLGANAAHIRAFFDDLHAYLMRR